MTTDEPAAGGGGGRDEPTASYDGGAEDRPLLVMTRGLSAGCAQIVYRGARATVRPSHRDPSATFTNVSFRGRIHQKLNPWDAEYKG